MCLLGVKYVGCMCLLGVCMCLLGVKCVCGWVYVSVGCEVCMCLLGVYVCMWGCVRLTELYL